MMTVSIITITYNAEQWLERTMQSVLAQTCTDYEYIIVDGASKDKTVDIIQTLEPQFEGRLSWKSEPDKGLYGSSMPAMKYTEQILWSMSWLQLRARQILFMVKLVSLMLKERK